MEIIIKPIITEKATNDSELRNRYTFEVTKGVNKIQIKKAVQEKYNFDNLKVFASTGSPLSPSSYDWVYSNVKKDLQLSSISGGTDIVACFVHGNPCLHVKRGEIQCSSLGMDVQSWDDSGLRIFDLPGELVCINSFPSIPLGFWNDEDDKKFKEAYFEKYNNVWHHGDFVIETKDNSFIVEAKGAFNSQDRKKHKLIKVQHPELDIRFIFSNSKTKIGKKSLTTYGKWCDLNNFKYHCVQSTKIPFPKEWLEEIKNERRN